MYNQILWLPDDSAGIVVTAGVDGGAGAAGAERG